jgi:hypothetical protein
LVLPFDTLPASSCDDLRVNVILLFPYIFMVYTV